LLKFPFISRFRIGFETQLMHYAEAMGQEDSLVDDDVITNARK
jgi:hypothetical protein